MPRKLCVPSDLKMIEMKTSAISLDRDLNRRAATNAIRLIVAVLSLATCQGLSTVNVNAQDQPARAATENPDAAQRLTFMKESAQVYRFSTGSNDEELLKLQPDPSLRFTNPVGGLKDGTLFFWTSSDGRPYAAAQAFQIESGIWLHEFQSLTTESFRVTRDGSTVWSPTQAGIEWKSVPDAPVPANTPTQRLSQMKAIMDRFGANDDFEGASRWELRTLSKPLLRYSSEKQKIVDGATFAFVHTTDPEVFVVLEAVRGVDKDATWRYALAPMTAYALKVTLDGNVVWEKPWIKDAPITSSYKILVYKP
jgi:hypothetical protein